MKLEFTLTRNRNIWRLKSAPAKTGRSQGCCRFNRSEQPSRCCREVPNVLPYTYCLPVVVRKHFRYSSMLLLLKSSPPLHRHSVNHLHVVLQSLGRRFPYFGALNACSIAATFNTCSPAVRPDEGDVFS